MLHFMSFFSNETVISDRYFASALDKKNNRRNRWSSNYEIRLTAF